MIKLERKKIQYGINRGAAKISPLSSRKIDKYEYLAGEEIIPSNQRQIKEHVSKSFRKTKRKTGCSFKVSKSF